MKIEPLVCLPDPEWLRMRRSLWPHTVEGEHLAEMRTSLAEPHRFAQFRAVSDAGLTLGFAEASLRTDHVNGTDSSPVGYLEGLFVEPGSRRQGVARALVGAVAHWARSRGCSELASDTPLANLTSQAAHLGLGFAETQRIVFYNMVIAPDKTA